MRFQFTDDYMGEKEEEEYRNNGICAAAFLGRVTDSIGEEAELFLLQAAIGALAT